jgi:hypothetical protein
LYLDGNEEELAPLVGISSRIVGLRLYIDSITLGFGLRILKKNYAIMVAALLLAASITASLPLPALAKPKAPESLCTKYFFDDEQFAGGQPSGWERVFCITNTKTGSFVLFTEHDNVAEGSETFAVLCTGTAILTVTALGTRISVPSNIIPGCTGGLWVGNSIFAFGTWLSSTNGAVTVDLAGPGVVNEPGVNTALHAFAETILASSTL